MTDPSFSPVLDPKIAERIAASVAHLEVPPDVLLQQAYADMQRQIELRRHALSHEREHIRDECLAALARILLSADELHQPDKDYFNRS